MGCCQIKNSKNLSCDYGKTRENSNNLKSSNKDSMNLRLNKPLRPKIITIIRDRYNNLTVVKEVHANLEYSPLA